MNLVEGNHMYFNKLLIVFYIFFLLTPFNKIISSESPATLESLPGEIKRNIFEFLLTVEEKTPDGKQKTQIEKLYEAATNLRNFMQTNQEMKLWSKDPSITNYLITELSRRYTPNEGILDAVQAALALRTEGAGKFLATNWDKSIHAQVSFEVTRVIRKHFDDAFNKSNSEEVKFLTKHIPELAHSQNKNFEFPIELAAKKGDTRMVQVLLEAGANVNQQGVNSPRETPLIIAAENGNLELVELLIKAKANINLKDDHQSTALVYAVSQNNPLIVEKLLQAGPADLSSPNMREKTILPIATKNGNIQIMEMLIKAGADSNEDGLLINAAQSRNPQTIDTLMATGAKLYVNEGQGQPLHYAILHQDIPMIEKLIAIGASVEIVGHYEKSPLMVAIETDNMQIIEKLIAAGADVSRELSNRETPLSIAQKSQKPNKEKIIELLKKTAKGKSEEHALLDAVRAYNATAVENLLKNSPNPTALANSTIAQPSGITESTFLQAVDKGNNQIINSFLKAGANPNVSGKDGMTPLFYAVMNNNKDSIVQLIHYGANVNARFMDRSVVEWVGKRSPELIKILKDAGAN